LLFSIVISEEQAPLKGENLDTIIYYIVMTLVWRVYIFSPFSSLS